MSVLWDQQIIALLAGIDALDQQQFLSEAGIYWYYHPTTYGQLSLQCLGDVGRGCRYQDGVVGSCCWMTQASIPGDELDIRVPQLKQPTPCAVSEVGESLHCVDLSG